VFDTSGRAVRTVLDRQSFPSGRHTREWDLRSDSGRRVPPGIYFYRMNSGSYVGKRAVVVLK
jgi:flagellar hook assembly protein FlgD